MFFRLTAGFSAETIQFRRLLDNKFKVLKERENPENQEYFSQKNYPSEK
jgi:hypothetical protein